MTLKYFDILSHILHLIVILSKKVPNKISLYHKILYVEIIWNKYADVSLSYVLFWLHPPQNDSNLVISP